MKRSGTPFFLPVSRRGFPLLLLFLGLFLGNPLHLLAQEPVTTGETGVVRSQRKGMTYFPLALRTQVPPERVPAIEAAIRKAVEQGRFTLNDLGKLQGLSLEEVAQLLREYVDRTKLLTAREQASFDIRYKDLVVTAQDLRRIAESAFLYAPTLVGFQEEHHKYLVKEGKEVYWVHEYTFKIAVEVQFYRVDFATGKPLPVARVQGYGEGEKTSTLLRSPEDAREGAFAEALDHLHLTLRTAVRKVPEFQLRVNVDRATWNGAYFSLTRKDGLVLGSLLEVKEIGASGEEIPLGYLIVRDLGDGEVDTQSYAQIVALKGWKLTGGEMLFEHPQLNLRFTLSPLYQRVAVTAPGAPELASSLGWGLDLKGTRGFAEETGIYGLSGVAALRLVILQNYLELNGEVGGELLYNFRRLFLGPGLRLGYLRAFTDFRGESAYLESFGITPSFRVSLWITPGFSLDTEAGYRLYVPSSTLTNTDGDELPVPQGFRYNPSGFTAEAGATLRF